MGKNFKAPRRSDPKQWANVERLWQHGVTFRPGDHDLRRPPKRLNEVDAFLETREREQSEREAERKQRLKWKKLR